MTTFTGIAVKASGPGPEYKTLLARAYGYASNTQDLISDSINAVSHRLRITNEAYDETRKAIDQLIRAYRMAKDWDNAAEADRVNYVVRRMDTVATLLEVAVQAIRMNPKSDRYRAQCRSALQILNRTIKEIRK